MASGEANPADFPLPASAPSSPYLSPVQRSDAEPLEPSNENHSTSVQSTNHVSLSNNTHEHSWSTSTGTSWGDPSPAANHSHWGAATPEHTSSLSAETLPSPHYSPPDSSEMPSIPYSSYTDPSWHKPNVNYPLAPNSTEPYGWRGGQQRQTAEDNVPNRFELFLLADDEKKVTEAPDTRELVHSHAGYVRLTHETPGVSNASVFTFNKEDHTLGNMLRARLLQSPHVIFSAYKVPHPLFRYIFSVRDTLAICSQLTKALKHLRTPHPDRRLPDPACRRRAGLPRLSQ